MVLGRLEADFELEQCVRDWARVDRSTDPPMHPAPIITVSYTTAAQNLRTELVQAQKVAAVVDARAHLSVFFPGLALILWYMLPGSMRYTS